MWQKLIKSLLALGLPAIILGMSLAGAQSNKLSLTGAGFLSAITAKTDPNGGGIGGGDWSAPTILGQIGLATSLPSGKYQGDGNGVANFVACGEVVSDLSKNYRVVWGEADDPVSGFSYYERQVVKDGELIDQGETILNYSDVLGLTPGDYYLRVRAIDKAGNQTIEDQDWKDVNNYASWCQIKVAEQVAVSPSPSPVPSVEPSPSSTPGPTIEPSPEPSPSPSPEPLVVNMIEGQVPSSGQTISNGNFESDETNWQTTGAVSLVTNEQGVDPHSGSKMMRLGELSSPGQLSSPVATSIVSFDQLAEADTQIKNFGFWYHFGGLSAGISGNLQTGVNSGNKSGLMIFVDNQLVKSLWLNEAKNDWQFIALDLSQVENPKISLAFYQDGTGDNLVYLDEVMVNSEFGQTQNLELVDPEHVKFSLSNFLPFTKAKYLVEYSHLLDDQRLNEGVVGEVSLPSEQNSFTSEPIYLGTCSTLKESCVPHLEIEDLKLTISYE